MSKKSRRNTTTPSNAKSSKPVGSKLSTITKRLRQFTFSSTSGTRSVTPLFSRSSLRTPNVFYTPDVWSTIRYLVDKARKEIGWLGLVDTLPNGDYLITDIYVPEQTVSGTETDISTEAMAALAMELIEDNKDPSKLFYWGHSHVNMGVSPSGQDEEQVDEYLEDCDIFIRGIYNKKGESKVDVYNKNERVVFNCVHDGLYMDATLQNRLDNLMLNNVIEQTYAVSKPVQRTPAVIGNSADTLDDTDAYGGYLSSNYAGWND